MAAADLADAIQRVAKPPCEKGCANFSLCAEKELACGMFLNYVNGYKRKKAILVRPSRGVYVTIYRRTA